MKLVNHGKIFVISVRFSFDEWLSIPNSIPIVDSMISCEYNAEVKPKWHRAFFQKPTSEVGEDSHAIHVALPDRAFLLII